MTMRIGLRNAAFGAALAAFVLLFATPDAAVRSGPPTAAVADDVDSADATSESGVGREDRETPSEPNAASDDDAASPGGMSDAPEELPSVAGKTLVVPFEGVILPAENEWLRALVSGPVVTDAFMREALDRARRDGAALVVLEIDSPGGVVDTCSEISRTLIDCPVPTVALVTQDAISGASMVATACDEIVMIQGTTIGDCEPHAINQELPDYMREKIETMIRARMRANAEANGHPGKLLEAMVTKKMALYRITYGDDEQAFLTGEELELLEEQIESGESDRAIADRKLVVSEKRLLTLTAGEAREYGLAEGVAESLDAFYAARGVPVLDRVLHRPPEMVKHEMSMGWKALLVLCLIIGVAGAIVEAGVPGFGVPGVIGIIGFACFFIILAGHGRADAPEVLLFAAGVALILVEIFIIPGFGVAGIAGLLCLLGAFVLLYLPPFDSETMRRDWAGELEGMTVFFSIGGVLAIVAGWLLAAYAPRIPLVKSAILGMRLRSGKDIQEEVARGRDADRYRHEVDGEHTESDLKGVEGVTTTVLRPSGKMRADDGRALDVVSEGPVIAQGERVRVVEVNGPRITVAPVEEDSA